MKAGDVVWLGLLQANRDPARFDRPDRYVADRAPNPHLAFAGGVHRCLGAQLARAELAVAIEVWHRLIPDYRLADDAELVERGGQLMLLSVPLAWDVPDSRGAGSSIRAAGRRRGVLPGRPFAATSDPVLHGVLRLASLVRRGSRGRRHLGGIRIWAGIGFSAGFCGS